MRKIFSMSWCFAVCSLIGATAFLPLAAKSRATSGAQGSSPRSLPEWIPVALVDHAGSGVLRHGFQRGSIDVSTAGREVILEWSAGSEVNLDPAQSSLPVGALSEDCIAVERQSFFMRYYPLTAAVIDSSRILVGGVDAEQRAVIESWNFGWPDAMPAPASPTSGGAVAVNVVLPQRTVQRIHHGPTAPNFVANMTAVRRSNGVSTQALLQFRPSLDVYVLELQTGALTLLASPTAQNGALGQVDALGQQYFSHLYSKHHSTQGFVYFFTSERSRSTPFSQRPPVLLFLDGDRDGIIDSHQLVTAEQFDGSGSWSDAASYVDWWK